ncbi:MAG: hypothetical protein QXH30_03415, partial [Candidatus Bilamarchaeaceae archaeon]
SNSKDSFQGELPSIAERIRLEVALLEKEEMRGEASKSLAELAECPECSMTHAQAIVAILECKNSEWGGAISSQVRRAKKALEALSRKPSSMNSSNYPDGKKRDTLPYPKKPAAGAGQSECMAIKAPANGKQSSH